jgi:hypothetical protein
MELSQTTSSKPYLKKSASYQYFIAVSVVTIFLGLNFLLKGNMGMVNELDILPFTRQHIDPSWMPEEFWLNQPGGYRLPFILLFGYLTTTVGFLGTSIIGRLVCYILISSGLVFLGRILGLRLLTLLVALCLFIYPNPSQGAAAYEWLVGGVEPKSVAYGFLLLAIGFAITRRYRFMALNLGLATTFHVLVGGWATIAMVGWLGLRRRSDFSNLKRIGTTLLIYGLASAWAIWTVLSHLLESTAAGEVSSSYIYVFLRSPHHLNPLSWTWYAWGALITYLIIFGLSIFWLRRRQQQNPLSKYRNGQDLAEITLFALIPFGFGVVIAPFDTEGKILQYYPFRVGDILLPLTTCLLFAGVLQHSLTSSKAKIFQRFCLVLVSAVFVIQGSLFINNLQALSQFPSQQQGVTEAWRDTFTWIRENTPKDALIVSPPVDLANFTWLTERATVGKFKQAPPTSASLIKWHQRLTDLSGGSSLWTEGEARYTKKQAIRDALTQGFRNLDLTQAQAILDKYQASYFLTYSEHQLGLPIVYQNNDYVVYSRE